jgi:hypothetical protein
MRGHKKKAGTNRWRLIYDLPPDPGQKRRQQRQTFYGTSAEADARLGDIVRGLREGDYAEKPVTIAELVELFVKAKTPKWAATTSEAIGTCERMTSSVPMSVR